MDIEKENVSMKVSLFITCFNDTLFPETGRAVVYLLERLGYTVDFPQDQTCCGQMHYNTGVTIFFRARHTLSPLRCLLTHASRQLKRKRCR
jgi:Fe-S oxidoreductase